MNNISQEFHKLLPDQNPLILILHSKILAALHFLSNSSQTRLPLLVTDSVVSDLDAEHYVHDNNLNLVIIARKMIVRLRDRCLHYMNQNIFSNLDHNIQK